MPAPGRRRQAELWELEAREWVPGKPQLHSKTLSQKTKGRDTLRQNRPTDLISHVGALKKEVSARNRALRVKVLAGSACRVELDP